MFVCLGKLAFLFCMWLHLRNNELQYLDTNHAYAWDKNRPVVIVCWVTMVLLLSVVGAYAGWHNIKPLSDVKFNTTFFDKDESEEFPLRGPQGVSCVHYF